MSRTRLALIALTILEAGFALAGVAAALGIASPEWAFDFPRFLAPPVARGLAAVTILAMGLAVVRRPRNVVRHAGTALAIGVTAGLLAAIVALPDRSGFLGDFLLRQGAIAAGRYDRSFPQGLPLDHLLFGHVLPAFVAITRLPLPVASRGIGVLAELALLAIAGLGWRRAGLAAPAALLGTLLVGATGLASMFTGFARDTVALLPIVLALAFTLAERVEHRRPFSPAAEWLLLAALALHRTSAVLLAPYLVATGFAWRDPRPPGWKWAAALLALGVAVLLPIDVAVFTSFDLTRHTPWLAPGHFALLPLLHPGYLADVLGALALLAPVAFASALLLLPGPDRAARWLDAAFVLVWVPVVLLTEPQQGVFRDFDVYAPMAVTGVFVGARQLVRLRSVEPSWSGRAARMAAVAGLQSFVAVLLVASNPGSTRARVLDALARWPQASAIRRAQWLDWLESDAERSGDRAAAARLAVRSAEAVPSRLRWIRAALAATDAGDFESARTDYGRVLAIDSSSVIAWCGVAGSSAALFDSSERDVALGRVRGLIRDRRRHATAVRFMTSSPQVDPTGVVGAALRVPPTAP